MNDSTSPSPPKPIPHVHAELIKAWADGAEIQYWSVAVTSKWVSIKNPSWAPRFKYRIKPSPKEYKYRLYLWQNNPTQPKAVYIYTPECPYLPEAVLGFIKWIGPWETYVDSETNSETPGV